MKNRVESLEKDKKYENFNFRYSVWSQTLNSGAITAKLGDGNIYIYSRQKLSNVYLQRIGDNEF